MTVSSPWLSMVFGKVNLVKSELRLGTQKPLAESYLCLECPQHLSSDRCHSTHLVAGHVRVSSPWYDSEEGEIETLWQDFGSLSSKLNLSFISRKPF